MPDLSSVIDFLCNCHAVTVAQHLLFAARMSFKDFCQYFTTLEMCSLGPDSMSSDDESGKNQWSAKQEAGQWVKRVNAGGCRNFLDTFWTNPQYKVTTTDPDDDDDDDLCTVVIGLMQKDRRKKREEGLDMLTIGYVIYKVRLSYQYIP